MERPTCSSSSKFIGPGARSRSPTAVLRSTSPPACANSPTFTFPRQNASASSSTICRRTSQARSIRPSRRQRRDACCDSWSSTTFPNMPAGSTWSRSRSVCCAANVWTAHRHQAAAGQRNHGLGTTAQCLRSPHQMDVHNRKSPRQNGPRLSQARFRPRGTDQRVIITVQRY